MFHRTSIPGILLLISLSPASAQVGDGYSEEFMAEQLRNTKDSPNNRISLEVAKPIEEVFVALLSQLPNYSAEVMSITFDNSNALVPGEIGIGSRRVSVMNNEDILVQRIIEFDPPNSFAYFTEMSESTIEAPLDFSVGSYIFTEQAGGGTKVEVSAAYRASSRITGFLVRMGFSRAFTKDFREAQRYLNSREP